MTVKVVIPQAVFTPIHDNGGFNPNYRRHFEQVAEVLNDTYTQSATTTATVAAQANYISLITSYVTGCTITGHDAGADATINISAHARQYDTGAIAVDAGSVTGLAYGTVYWVYYDDPTHVGTPITYLASISYTDAFTSFTQPDRHFVGSIRTPAALDPDTMGIPIKPIGYNEPP